MNLYAECYRIAERVHQGIDEETLQQECRSVAARAESPRITWKQVYSRTEAIYAREFESR